ncbi:helix-turn-helix transcriptional regulator [Streptomyces sp. SID3343]|uniref:helix-turn-helix transcriptional regulator n=1 Tax=Streptomyces sp. SID3343 TaxID=2690260 RepID=UPI00136F2FE0|nr:helix-turn-helix transcriptional regulator [Streptomyces sp. SID3343]MYV99122.1 hypothetical protein [Streptomyces sp. SID3343]
MRPYTPGNPALVAARHAKGWHSQEEFAEAFDLGAQRLGERVAVSPRQVRRWESAKPGWPHPPARRVLAALFETPVERLGFVPPSVVLPDEAEAAAPDDGAMNRRSFLASPVAVSIAPPRLPRSPGELLTEPPRDPLDAVRAQLAAHGGPVMPADELLRAARSAKGHVQACRYGVLLAGLPGLLAAVRGTQNHTDDPRVQHAAVAAYHVAASLLLKRRDAASAWIAADRAARAAHILDDPAATGSAARIVVHAMGAVGHHRQAVLHGADMAHDLTRHLRKDTPELVSVFGALLLRAAWAAAETGQAATAAALLADAEQAAAMLSGDGNHGWTAFGPTNVAVHRVSLALTLGNAGHAVEAARGVDVAGLEVAERRAVFWLDVARALAACGRTEQAGVALLTAEEQAPEEIHSRTIARNLTCELVRRDEYGRLPELRSLAVRSGVPL